MNLARLKQIRLGKGRFNFIRMNLNRVYNSWVPRANYLFLGYIYEVYCPRFDENEESLQIPFVWSGGIKKMMESGTQ
jgi:hypothetical protein